MQRLSGSMLDSLKLIPLAQSYQMRWHLKISYPNSQSKPQKRDCGWSCLLLLRSPIPTTFGRRRHVWAEDIESFMSPWESERESNEVQVIADYGIYVLMTSLLHDVLRSSAA